MNTVSCIHCCATSYLHVEGDGVRVGDRGARAVEGLKDWSIYRSTYILYQPIYDLFRRIVLSAIYVWKCGNITNWPELENSFFFLLFPLGFMLER